MTPGASVAKGRAVDVTAVVVAASILLVLVAFVATTLVVGIAQQVWSGVEDTSSSSCSSSMDTVMTPAGQLTCLPQGTRPPRGWFVVSPAD